MSDAVLSRRELLPHNLQNSEADARTFSCICRKGSGVTGVIMPDKGECGLGGAGFSETLPRRGVFVTGFLVAIILGALGRKRRRIG